MPTFSQTAKYALRWLTGSNVISDIDAGFQALAEDADSKFAGTSAGPLASRPTSTAGSPGIAGRFYLATDSGQFFVDNGTGWNEIPLGTPATVPTATVLAYGAATAPTGYLACDGSAVDRTTYSGLFAVIGTTHGAGNGTSTFNVPDLRGRAPVGAGQGTGLTNRTLGSKFGEESHALTSNELAAHAHGGTIAAVGDHAHGGAVSAGAVMGAGYQLAYASTDWTAAALTSPGNALAEVAATSGSVGTTQGSHTHGLTINLAGGHSHALTINNTGNGEAHNNVQPSTAVSYIIKT